jgi:hypothetical protein
MSDEATPPPPPPADAPPMPAQGTKPTKPTGVTPVFALGEIMRRAMQTSYGMISREAVAGIETQTTVEAIADLLVAKGVVTAEEVAAQREIASKRVHAERSKNWAGPWLTMVPQEKSPQNLVDCETRYSTCKASCCTFYKVILSEGEVRAGKLLWDLGAPYSLPRGPEGHCAYLDRDSLKCTVWADRPHVCRGYTCTNDKEIWQDFDAMVPTERVRTMSRSTQTKRGVP